MRRRNFIVAGLAAPAVWSLSARAQQPSIPVIGFLNSASADTYAQFATAFHRGLAETGFVEGRNVLIEYRWANGDYARFPALTAELAQLRPTVIFTNGPPAPHVKRAVTTIPVVFAAGFDPIAVGVVSNLKQPGGNITGVTVMNVELGPKRLELLRELVPGSTTLAALINPTNPNVLTQTRELQAAANRLDVMLHIVHARTDGDFPAAFEALRQLGPGALLIGSDPFFTTRSRKLAELSVHHSLPAIYQYREFVAAGGLMSYGSSLANAFHLAGIYVGRILNGEKPGDLPVQQSTKIELMLNLKTAKMLSLEVPPTLLARADEVIE